MSEWDGLNFWTVSVDYASDILKAIQDGNQALERFKDRLETLEAKSNRPHFGGDPSQARALARSANLDSSDPEIKSFNEYLRRGESKAMSTGSGPDGGYAVPKVIDGMIETLLLPQSPIRNYATVQQISTPDFHKLVNTRGTQALWVGETDSRPATNTSQLVDVAPPIGEIYCNLVATQQMLDDVQFNASQWLAQEAADAFGESESSKFISGNAVNQPKGILSYPTAATADATRPFGTLQYIPTGNATGFMQPITTASDPGPFDALQKMVFSMHPGYRGDAVWLMNSTTLGLVGTFKDSLGRFLLIPNPQAGQPPMLLGYPVVEAMHMPDVAANAFPVAFANLRRGYLIVDRIGTRVLVDPFSSKPNVQHYVTKRTGGSIQNSRAIKLLKIATS